MAILYLMDILNYNVVIQLLIKWYIDYFGG